MTRKEINYMTIDPKKVSIGINEALKSAITAFGIDEAMEQGRVVDMAPLWRRAGIVVPEA